MKNYDVLIVGAGAVGCSLAKLLSEFSLSICVAEKENDVAFGTSGRNSGVLHAGFNNPEGSLKAALCVKGNRNFPALAEELGIELKRTGKLVTGFGEKDLLQLKQLLERGKANGVEDLRIIESNEIRSINSEVDGDHALYSPNTGIFSPFEYTIALAETAFANGADFRFCSKVSDIERNNEGFSVEITKIPVCLSQEEGNEDSQNREGKSDEEKLIKERVSAKVVVNCAGLFSGDIANMVGIDRYEIRPCRGEYHIFERLVPDPLGLPVYPVPDEERGVLGVHLTPTTRGNIMAGPSAEFLEDNDDYSNTEYTMAELSAGAEQLMPQMKNASVIRSFAGIRPKLIDKEGVKSGDFVIEEGEGVPGFINLMGIESPGITASMPVAEMASELVFKAMGGVPERKTELKNRNEVFAHTDDSVSSDGIEYRSMTKMVCRCESVPEGEILRAWDNILKLGGVPSVKGVKNRTGAFMGSCQGCFCTIDTAELVRRYRDMKSSALTYDGAGSEMFYGPLRKAGDRDD